MGISLDLYDFFAHLIPGGFFVMAFLYRFQEPWLRSPAFSQLSTAHLLAIALLSYVLGYVIDPLSSRWYKFFRPESNSFSLSKKAAQTLCQNHPQLHINAQKMSWYVVLAYIKRYNLPMAQEIERFNVTHIMLRGISLGLLFFSLVFCSKILTGVRAEPYVFLSLLSMAMSYLLIQEAIKFRRWFHESIYQAALALTLTPDQLPITYRASPK